MQGMLVVLVLFTRVENEVHKQLVVLWKMWKMRYISKLTNFGIFFGERSLDAKFGIIKKKKKRKMFSEVTVHSLGRCSDKEVVFLERHRCVVIYDHILKCMRHT